MKLAISEADERGYRLRRGWHTKRARVFPISGIGVYGVAYTGKVRIRCQRNVRFFTHDRVSELHLSLYKYI